MSGLPDHDGSQRANRCTDPRTDALCAWRAEVAHLERLIAKCEPTSSLRWRLEAQRAELLTRKPASCAAPAPPSEREGAR